MAPLYPLHLDVSGRRVLVAGGGPVAARRARDLVEAGADVLVVAPAVCEDLRDLLPLLTWEARDVDPADVADVWLVHTATGDPAADAAVAAAAEALHVWCVVAAEAAAGSAWTPVVVRRDVGGAPVTVSATAGGDPRRATGLREALSRWLDSGAAPLRRRRPGRGRVTLVGGGPGEVDLLTLRGRRRLAEADVVVVDRLAPTAVLADLDPDVVVVDVGKTPDHHPVPQDEINRLLVEHAQAGRHVVRLKGGDPYLLGRGGEEVLACRAAGVDVEVVPGVTSAFAVPAAAGIPVTHRGVSRSVTVVSGHEDVDAAALASLDGTLVLLMGVTMLPRTADGLLAAGKAPDTPVAIVENGWRAGQRTIRGTLSDIAVRAAREGVRNPAVIVVGAVAALEGLADTTGEVTGEVTGTTTVAYRPHS